MGEAGLLQSLTTVALAIGLAACAGLRAWLPLLLVGVLARLGKLSLGPDFAFVASNQALLVFGAATVLELIGDKIPAVDHALDALGTLIRPAAGALLAAAVIGRIEDPLTSLVLGVIVGAPSALVPHAAKTLVRGAATTLTAGLANPILSVIEDVFTLVLFVLSVLVPIAVAVVLIAASVFIVRRLTRGRSVAERSR